MLFDLITSKYHKNENSAKMLWQGSRVVVFFLHFNTASTLNWETYSKIATFFFFFQLCSVFMQLCCDFLQLHIHRCQVL